MNFIKLTKFNNDAQSMENPPTLPGDQRGPGMQPRRILEIQGGFEFFYQIGMIGVTFRYLLGIAVDSWIVLSFLGRVESLSKVFSSHVF
jgi:hypothetical protein